MAGRPVLSGRAAAQLREEMSFAGRFTDIEIKSERQKGITAVAVEWFPFGRMVYTIEGDRLHFVSFTGNGRTLYPHLVKLMPVLARQLGCSRMTARIPDASMLSLYMQGSEWVEDQPGRLTWVLDG